ncbi:MAG: AAA family ATPase [Granulosicoccus sp.]
MRLEKLALRRYGHFTDFELNFGEQPASKPDLHVLYGPNEAGKSTTLAAITDLLFGFRKQTPWNFIHTNDMLELEAVLFQAPQRVSLKRFKNRLTNMSHERLERMPLDLQGLSRDDFTRRFSFDEQALQEGGEQILNSQGDVGHALFSASAGLSNLKTMLNKVMEDADNFWEPNRVAKKELTALKQQLREKQAKIKSIRLDSAAYGKRLKERDAAEARRNDFRRECSEVQQRINEIEQKIKASSFAIRYRQHAECRQALESDGVVAIDCPGPLVLDTGEAARAALEKTRQQIEDIRQAMKRRTEQKTQLQSLSDRRQALEFDEQGKKILAAADRITALSTETSAGYEWLQQQAGYLSTIEQCDEKISTFVKRFNLESVSTLESCLPGQTQLKELRTLLSKEQSLRDKLAFTKDELEKLGPEPAEPEPDTEEPLPSVNIDLLENIATRIQQEGLIKQLELAEDKLLKAKQKAGRQATQLGLSVSSLPELDIPESDWLNSRLSELTKARQEASQLQSHINSLQTEILDKKATCRKLTQSGAVDKDHWQRQKLERDKAWQTHSSAIDNQASQATLQQSAREFQVSMHQHDEQTSTALDKSDETAKLRVLGEQIEATQQQLQALEGETSQAIEKRVQRLSQRILERVASFHKYSELDIDSLRQRHTAAKEFKDIMFDCDNCELEVEQIRQRCNEACHSLQGLLGTEVAKTLHLQDLLPYALKTLESAKQTLQEQRLARTEREKQRNAFAERSDVVRSAESALEQWQAFWKSAIADSLFATMTLAQARDTLPEADKMQPVLERRREALEKNGVLQNRTKTRDEAIATLLSDLQCKSLEEANEQLQRLQNNRELSQAFEKDIATVEASLADSKTSLDLQLGELEELRQIYGCDNDVKLIACLSRTEKHRVANDSCVDTLEQLYDLTGERFDDAAVERLIAEHEAGELTPQLQKHKDKYAELSDAYDRANESYALANQAVEDVDDSSEYARLIQQQRNLLLEIEEQARRTMVARTGKHVLLAAMAKFRQENQSAILSQAQQAFATLTLGKYVRLLPREDKQGREQLYAIDSSEKARAVNELSTGTRYQLYLALRAAAYADYAVQRPPLPFVADDIMESFDDNRSAAAFRVMGGMAELGQVLYLTHHKHLIDIAQEVMGKDRVRIHYYQGAD